jgi:hypothetical protein
MSWGKITAEMEAYQSVSMLFEAARKCQELHERAGLQLPERVRRLIEDTLPTESKSVAPPMRPQAQISPLTLPSPAPKEAADGWISILASEATVTTVALAFLREAEGERVRSRDLNALVLDVLPSATPGSIANSGTRLSTDGVIDRNDDGWRLLKPDMAAILKDERLWGPPSIFIHPEIAAHRREAILHILAHYSGGLQTVQIVEQLKGCPWLHAPVNKDILKMDMQTLSGEKKVRRVGNTRKWQIAPGGAE